MLAPLGPPLAGLGGQHAPRRDAGGEEAEGHWRVGEGRACFSGRETEDGQCEAGFQCFSQAWQGFFALSRLLVIYVLSS